jgi:hypothetical protein
MQLCTLGLVSLDLHACVTVNDDQLAECKCAVQSLYYRKVKGVFVLRSHHMLYEVIHHEFIP